jgi:hypothetical protein
VSRCRAGGSHRPGGVHQAQGSPAVGSPPPIATKTVANFDAFNLPIPRTSFLGREVEVEKLVALVAQVPLVTITGSGGVGKTRLAVELGRRLLPSFPGGVWLVELGEVTDAESFAFALAAVLGVREEPGRPLEGSLVEAIQARRIAVILDNCEHVCAPSPTSSTGLWRTTRICE